MIDARIGKNGIERYEITGTPAEVVAEFGIMINQYCSAVKNAARRFSLACPGSSRPLLRQKARCGNWTRAWRGFS